MLNIHRKTWPSWIGFLGVEDDDGGGNKYSGFRYSVERQIYGPIEMGREGKREKGRERKRQQTETEIPILFWMEKRFLCRQRKEMKCRTLIRCTKATGFQGNVFSSLGASVSFHLSLSRIISSLSTQASISSFFFLILCELVSFTAKDKNLSLASIVLFNSMWKRWIRIAELQTERQWDWTESREPKAEQNSQAYTQHKLAHTHRERAQDSNAYLYEDIHS